MSDSLFDDRYSLWADYDRRVREEVEWEMTEAQDFWDKQLPLVKTSGDQQTWDTGAVRDSQEGKLRFDLIDPNFLARVAERMRLGAEHYGEFNWTKGIPSQRYMASLLRHVFAYYSGDRSEDHLGAVGFNLMGIMRNEGTELDDLFQW